MYHCDLYYRVDGHLVHYNSNGTDREGMRGAANTWLEIVAQGLSTRLCRERGLVKGKSTFLSFIDDGLRKFSIQTRNRSHAQCLDAAMDVIKDVEFGLKVLGRELSWDKTYVSKNLFVILNELVYDGAFISSGLKSFCSVGDIELREVMSAADYEQLYFGKMRGAHSVGTPVDLCHYMYIYETLISHYKMGLRLQDNRNVNNLDYRLFCMTPLALGGGGMRTMLQMSCNESANATKEGMATLLRMCVGLPILRHCVDNIIDQPLDELSPVDFMRDPEQFHVIGPRVRTQRLAGEVRKYIHVAAQNDLSRRYVEQDKEGMKFLEATGKLFMTIGNVSAEEVRLVYAMSPVSFIDNFIQKLTSSSTLAELLGKDKIKQLRRQCRRDLVMAVNVFQSRSRSDILMKAMSQNLSMLAAFHEFLVK